MSIKIDLLPGYINLQRWFKNWLLIALAALLLTGAALYLLYYQGQQTLEVTKKDLENIEPFAKRAEETERTTTAAQAEAAPIEANVKFLVSAGKTGAERAALIDLVRRYIYSGAVVSLIDMSDGQNVTVNATVRDPEEYLRFVLALREGSATNNGLLFAADPRTQSVVPSGIGGFPNSQFIEPQPLPGQPARTYQYPLSVTAVGKLKDPVVVPSEAAAAPAAGTTGTAGTAGTTAGTASPTPSPSPKPA